MPFRLDTLRVKLFLAIAGANLVLVMAAYLIYGWSFDQGLGDYLNKTETARLDPLVARLAEGYRQNSGWEWLTRDRAVWPELVREELGGSRRRDGRGDERPDERGRRGDGPSGMPLTMDPRLLVLDADGTVLIGLAERAEQAVRKPVRVEGHDVGYLAYVPRLQVVASLERVFSAQQNRRFGAIAIGLLAAVLVNAALISQWLARRLRALSGGATALAQGHYATRLTVHSDDELARLAGDFNRLAAALEAAQNARRQWIADIAHELRTPLATLRAEIEALEDGVRPMSVASLGSLAQEVSQLTRLVEDLRVLSLSDLGALTYRKEVVALAESIEDCLASQHTAIDDKPLAVELELDRTVRIHADVDRLAQVFANLLQNTLRYTDSPARLKVELATRNGRALLTWADSSPGVPQADLPRLTERLYRVDVSRARSSGGSGLGLAIVKAIVEAHEGTLVAAPSALGGLAWTIDLPLATGLKMAERILIVEDEDKIGEVLRDYLHREGYETHRLSRGDEVVDWVRANGCDLVLLDLMLPGRSGLDVCQDLRSFSSTAIIMVTARVDEIDRLLGLALQADDYICKPFSPREVVARVKAVLRRTHAAAAAPATTASTPTLQLHADRWSASIGGRDLGLTVVEFQLLSVLHGQPGRIFSRDQLMDAMYRDDRTVADRTVDSHVKKLRRKIADVIGDRELIHSVYGAGYKFEDPA